MPTALKTTPSQSKRCACVSSTGTNFQASTNASTPTGTFTKKIHSQPAASTRKPPRIGPTSVATPAVTPQTAIAEPRSRGAKMRVMTAIVCGVMRAAPKPWKTRAVTSTSMVCDSPHASEATVNTVSPMRYTRRGPKRSPRRPVMSSGTAYESRYALVAHSVAVIVVLRPVMMVGFATDTIVVSTRIMKKPSTSDHSAGQGRITAPRASVCIPPAYAALTTTNPRTPKRAGVRKTVMSYFTAALSFEPTETLTRLPAGISMLSPVRGLRPVRAAVVAASNEIQPGMDTFSPAATVSETAAKRPSSTFETAAWLWPVSAAILATSSVLLSAMLCPSRAVTHRRASAQFREIAPGSGGSDRLIAYESTS